MLKFFFSQISSFLSNKSIYIVKSLSFKSNTKLIPINFDYVRYRTLELCAEEINLKKIKGNIAEVGVYRGNFAEKLNILFGDKKIYLFDTFEGFDQKDVALEQKNNFSPGTQNFSNTSVQLVLDKMKHKENAIIKKGFFPETAVDVDDTFCFVSLDADLYQPILEGLRFFYPRLQNGGYIFIHDFNNEEYKGSRKAVMEFCEEHRINYLPIPDNGGSAIISK